MHQCLKCKKLYEDDAVPILTGCECTSRLFLYVKNAGDIERADQIKDELSAKIEQIERQEKHAKRAIGKPKKAAAKKGPKKRFGVETIKVHDIGIYEINLEALMEGTPIIVLSKGGSYIISLPSIFGREEELKLK